MKNLMALFSWLILLSSQAAAQQCEPNAYHFGDGFCVSANTGSHALKVLDFKTGKTLFSFSKEDSVRANLVRTKYAYSSGSFDVKEQLKESCGSKPFDSVRYDESDLVVSGGLKDSCRGRRYEIRIALASNGHLNLDFSLQNFPETKKENWRFLLRYDSSKDEKMVGFGEQFTEFNMKGKKLPIISQEQGHGRGAQPLTGMLGLVSNSAGSWHTTYASVPQYISSKGRSLYHRNLQYSIFDMSEDDITQLEVDADNLKLSLLEYGSPREQLTAYTRYSGRMSPLPRWTQEGAIVCLMGGSSEVRRKLKLLLDANVPVTGVWIQDWVGHKDTMFGKRMEWNWALNEKLYPDMPQLIRELRTQDIQVMGYINPYVADKTSNPTDFNTYDEFSADDLFLKKADGSVAGMRQGGFTASIVDLSNPKAKERIKSIIRENFVDQGMRGWMADFGEAVPFDVAPFSGEDPKTFHSNYVRMWNDLQKEVIEEAGLEGEVLVFQRAGIATSPKSVVSFWLGDQTASWDKFDGLESTLFGLLSSGLSGYSINHSDVGGIMEINLVVSKIRRSEELTQRWMELNAFTSLFRTHEGISPWDKQVQVYDGPYMAPSFAMFAEIFRALAPYRSILMEEAENLGLPLVRPMLLNSPEQDWAWKATGQFMLGDDLVMAPVMTKGQRSKDVYLPKGEWRHLWTGKEYSAGESGLLLKMQRSELGRPLVYYRLGSMVEELISIENNFQNQSQSQSQSK